MKLYGMLDSPYVRRLAIGLHLRGHTFEHLPLSVFADYAELARINPAVKVPTLVLDDGCVLSDSSLILAHFDALADAPLLPRDGLRLQAMGLALAACEKSVQLVYEQRLRPEEKRHAPWVERVSDQLHGALAALDSALADPRMAASEPLDQASIDLAVTWSFTQLMIPDRVDAARYPRLAAHAARLEASEPFRQFPLG